MDSCKSHRVIMSNFQLLRSDDDIAKQGGACQ